EQVVRHVDAARAGHVLRYDDRIAWNVLADVSCHEPRLQVVFAADTRADQYVDGLAAIEVRDRLGLRRQGGRKQHKAAEDKAGVRSRHYSFLPGRLAGIERWR